MAKDFERLKGMIETVTRALGNVLFREVAFVRGCTTGLLVSDKVTIVGTRATGDGYYLFEPGKPLKLQSTVTKVAHQPMRNFMRLTTLTRLESVTKFAEGEKVCEEAMA